MLEKTRYSDSELEEFKVLIEDKLIAAQEQLNLYNRQINGNEDSNEEKIRGAEEGNVSIERERLYTMISRQSKHIEHLKNALLRIENKVYGICRETGKLISKERLRAVPHATLSIEGKEKEGKR
jgi:DnaK suppressor protein